MTQPNQALDWDAMLSYSSFPLQGPSQGLAPIRFSANVGRSTLELNSVKVLSSVCCGQTTMTSIVQFDFWGLGWKPRCSESVMGMPF